MVIQTMLHLKMILMKMTSDLCISGLTMITIIVTHSSWLATKFCCSMIFLYCFPMTSSIKENLYISIIGQRMLVEKNQMLELDTS